MALWRKNMVIPEYQRKKSDRPNYIRSSGGFYEAPPKNAKTIEEHFLYILIVSLTPQNNNNFSFK